MKSKIKSKSTTHSAGSWSNQCSLEGALRLFLNLNRTPYLLPNLDLHPTLNLSPGHSRDQKHQWWLAPFRSLGTSFRKTPKPKLPSSIRWNFAMRVLLEWTVSGVLGLIGAAAQASAADAKPTDDPSRNFFGQYCQNCHAGEKPKGDFRIDALSQDFADKNNREKWLNVVEQLKTGTMPPKATGKPRPSAEEAKVLTDWIDGQVATAQTARNALQGRAVMRRLNQVEYQNTVRDLLSVDVDLTGVLPVDTAAGGFDTSAETLHMSSYQLDGYLAAASLVLDAAVAGGPRPARVKRHIDLKNDSGTRRHGVYRHLDDAVAIFASDLASNIQLVFWNFHTRDRGQYRFRISAYAYQSKMEKPVLFHVNGGTNNLGDPPYLIGYFEAYPGKPTVIEFVEQMEVGRNIRLLVDTEMRVRAILQRMGRAENYQGPGVAVQWVEMEGPLEDSWPPPSYRLLFGDLPQAPAARYPDRREVVSQQPLADAEAILRKFTRRAFRRSVTDEDIKPFLDRVRTKLDEGYSFEQGAARRAEVGARFAEFPVSPREHSSRQADSGSPGDLGATGSAR